MILDDKQTERLRELAHKQKAEGLTEKEEAERWDILTPKREKKQNKPKRNER